MKVTFCTRDPIWREERSGLTCVVSSVEYDVKNDRKTIDSIWGDDGKQKISSLTSWQGINRLMIEINMSDAVWEKETLLDLSSVVLEKYHVNIT